MSDNQIINQSMLNGNYDWMLILIVVAVCVIAFISQLNRLREEKETALKGQRWLISGKWCVCAMCAEKYLKSTVNGQEIPVKKLGNEYSHAKCDDCKCIGK